MYGGEQNDSIDLWEWNGTRWTNRPTNAGPHATTSHAAVAFDSARNVIVLFDTLRRTWEHDGHSWTMRSSTGPAARSYSSMVFDEYRGVCVLFGGGFPRLGDTWEWDGTVWLQRASTGPAPRLRHAMAYDSARHRTVLFGGETTEFASDLWEWDGLVWQQVAASGPNGRTMHTMCYDAARARTILFGGIGKPTPVDTWSWDGTVWSIEATSGPSPRHQAGMVYDLLRQRVVLYGGWEFADSFGDTWEFVNGQWTEKQGTAPRIYGYAETLTFDSTRGLATLFSGHYPTAQGGPSLFVWNGSSWSSQSVSGPPARTAHAATFDSLRGRLMIFGGFLGLYGNSLLGDLWEFDGTRWIDRGSSGPSPRYRAAMAYDTARGVTMLFGGNGQTPQPLLDTWEWNGQSWTLRTTNGPALFSVFGLVYNSRAHAVTLFGSLNGLSADRVHTWNGSQWTEYRITGNYPHGYFMGISYDSNRSVTVGSVSTALAIETWEFNDRVWTKITAAGQPQRGGGGMCYDSYRGRTVLVGQLRQDTLGANPVAEYVGGRPDIAEQPTSLQVCGGGDATLSVIATGNEPLQYQWRKDGMPILGANEAVLSVESVDFYDSGTYDVRVSNSCGDITSDGASIGVQVICSGDVNHDGIADGRDIVTFIDILYNHPNGPPSQAFYAADVNWDGLVNADDVPLFVNLLVHGG